MRASPNIRWKAAMLVSSLLMTLLNLGHLAAQESDAEFFERRVRPILAEHCYSCHSSQAEKLQAGLKLNHRDWILQGGDSGPAIIPGNPNESLIIQAVRYEAYEMPPSSRLPQDQVDTLVQWVERGAYWPDEPTPAEKESSTPFDWQARRDSHWAWQPIRNPAIPNLPNDHFSQQELDRFILKDALSHARHPNSQADRSVLIRRLYLDLIGIPPTPEQLQQDLQDPRPDWYERILDRLLASPQFGVRMARHWLDLVRYADSRGHEFDEDSPGARHYRDYVVRAFNQDVPYDQFVLEHLAGDLLDPPRTNVEGWNESVLATGFWFLGEWVHSPVDSRKDETDRFDNMVDVFSKTFQGLTVACARCHDHKFDAIPSSDYYALYGFLRSSHYRLARFETDPNHREQAQKLSRIRETYPARWRLMLKELAEREKSHPHRATRWKDWTDPSSMLAALPSHAPPSQGLPLPSQSPNLRVDFTIPSTHLRTDGHAFNHLPRSSGSWEYSWWDSKPQLAVQPWTAAHYDRFWDRLESHEPAINRQNRYLQLREAGRTLATPTFELSSNALSYLIRGNVRAFVEVDSLRLISGPLHQEVLQDFTHEDNTQFRWVTHRLDRYPGKRVRIEFAPLDQQGCDIAQVADGIIQTSRPMTMPDALALLASQPSPPSDSQVTAAWECLTTWLDHPPTTPDESTTLDHHWWMARYWNSIANAWSQGKVDDPLHDQATQLLTLWKRDEEKVSNDIVWKSHVAMAMTDGSGENDSLLIRGNPSAVGPIVERRYLQALSDRLAPRNLAPSQGSGRLELAQCLLDPNNPLTHRVYVNRLWHHFFGKGIVPTTDDFGFLGQRPSHPELLDHLAMKLRRYQGSTKRLLRDLLGSATYRQSSLQQPVDRELDPDNIWLSRARVRRLEGEAIRDTLLAVSGQLDCRLDSETIPVYLTDFLQGRGRPGVSGSLDSLGRRSLFIATRRNFLPPMLTVFDMPTPFSSMGRRNVSNVPAQSLMLMNDPLVHQLANTWGQRLADENATLEQRVHSLYGSAFGRKATKPELTLAFQYLESASDAEGYRLAWQQLVHVVLNSKELIFRF